MTAASRDPHKIQSELEGVEEYQAPPRDHEQNAEAGHMSAGADDPVDVELLVAQQGTRKPKMSATKDSAVPTPESTVSGKDELADPVNPRAVPPGERM